MKTFIRNGCTSEKPEGLVAADKPDPSISSTEPCDETERESVSLFSGIEASEVLRQSARDSLTQPPHLESESNRIYEPRVSNSQRAKSINSDFSFQKLSAKSLGKLYGRDEEITRLRSLFSTSQHQRCFATISGPSGTGKSALAATLQSSVENSNGFYVSGKFDLAMAQAEPFSALKQAMTKLVDQILNLATQDTARYQSIKNRILESRDSISMLTRMLPALESLLYDQSDAAEPEPEPSNRDSFVGRKEDADGLNFAFKNLIASVSQSCPLVIAADDCQWADQASLDLFQSWITDMTIQIPRLMMIMCYRNIEVNQSHPLMKTVENIRNCSSERGIELAHLVLGNMDQDSSRQMVADMLGLETHDTNSLADIVYQKSHGNAFFLIQFLISLPKQNLLLFNAGTMKWTWESNEIKEKTKATNNVVDLMTEKLHQHKNAAKLLPVAACLGVQFSIPDICTVMTNLYSELEKKDVQKMLNECEVHGFLESFEDESFAFVHDKVKEAALGLIPLDQQADFKYGVGEALLASLPADRVDKLIFTTTNLVNVKCLAVDPQKQLEIMNLNYLAGITAMSVSAFSAGCQYFQTADQLLPPNNWSTHYHLSLKIYTRAAEAAYCAGNFDLIQKYCDVILAQDKVPADTRFHTFNLLVEAALAAKKLSLAMDIGYASLKEIGIKIPRTKLGIVAEIVSGIYKLKRRPEEILKQVEQLPLVTDALPELIDKTFLAMSEAAYTAGQPEVMLSIQFVHLRICLQHGITKNHQLVPVLAFLLTGVLGDPKAGAKYSKLALDILGRTGNKQIECSYQFILGCFVDPWIKPYQSLIDPLLEAYRVGMTTGDILHSCGIFANISFLALQSGRPLAILEEDVNGFTKQMKDFSQDNMYWSTVPRLEAVQNLIGKGGNTTLLSCEDQIMNLSGDTGMAESTLIACKLDLAVFFCEYKLGAKLAVEKRKMICDAMRGHPVSVVWLIMSSLALFAQSRITGSRRLERLARRDRRVIKGFAKKGNPNVVGPLALLDAEALAVHSNNEKSYSKAVTAYNEAIRCNGRFGLTQWRALSSERLADLHWVQGETSEAVFSLKEAAKLYEDWGATAKVLKLEQKLEQYSAA